jgi:archaemetzincin
MITLIPMAEVNNSYIEALVKPLNNVFDQAVEIDEHLDIPPESWDARRKQFLADEILDYIPDFQDGKRHLGILNVDIYAFGLNFIFGEADANCQKALISLTRLRQEFYGQPADENLFHERMLKEAVHELGHTYRLKHCPDRFCVMHFSNGISDTDKKKGGFCSACLKRIKELK